MSEGKDTPILQQKSKHKSNPMLACKLVKEFALKEIQKIVSKTATVVHTWSVF